MMALPETESLCRRVDRWAEAVGAVFPRDNRAPCWAGRIAEDRERGPLRNGAPLAKIRDWENRYGFDLPASLRCWLQLSDGLYHDGPIVHPLTAIGPMIPFARVPGLLIQPESWFELGNPGRETVCIDLGYRWPGGDCPIFASGDDAAGSVPRVIASSFTAYLTRILLEGGREYWFDPGFVPLGDPWSSHIRNAPVPSLPNRLNSLKPRVRTLMTTDADDDAVAQALGISRSDAEVLLRHLQHAGDREP